ncbi:MAG: hypothetical protein A2804_01275 [Candidatus Pacebacteria bacterium RIFCSPHIGHO2_01_FULL_46_10]|nr:MAG: hypothetical protein A2804_01275 [Candidatus Pacebacteria bacterium RIFCSPHIGHO2_01_FULL_46_10]
MSLRTQITDQIKTAMKARDTVTLDALRYILSIVKNVEIDAKHELNDEEVLNVIQKEVKNRREAMSQFQQGGRMDIVTEEQKKLDVLLKFLPTQLSQQDVEEKVRAIVAALPSKDMSSAMKAVMAELKGKADGKMIADAVKAAIMVDTA